MSTNKRGIKSVDLKGYSGVMVEISTTIEGVPYATEVEIDSSMSEKQVENLKKVILNGFLETHKVFKKSGKSQKEFFQEKEEIEL